MNFRCAHLADIHFRGLSRHDEYREVFSWIFNRLKEENLDAIFIGGDIVHSKTQGISPELIDILVWWFKKLSSIARVHVILGNHDGLILNKDIVIPHTLMHQRNFVLIPLYEIQKDWKHPKLKRNIKDLISQLPNKDIRSIKQI